MGVVYKARHIHFGEIYAIKILWRQFGNNPTVLQLFMNEAKLLRMLSHPNIVNVSDVFVSEGEYCIVMEFVEGRTLEEIIRKEVGPIRRSRAIYLFKQMLNGIAYIHFRPTPIIHRDLKPANILITADDRVKIADFGIAKVLEAGQGASTVVKGTPVYMSPEAIIDPVKVDIRADIYSLGMTFYKMLCAKTPFPEDNSITVTAVYARIMNGEIPPPTAFYPGISEELSDFVMKAIHPDRERRFSSVVEMLSALEVLEKEGSADYGTDIPVSTGWRRFQSAGRVFPDSDSSPGVSLQSGDSWLNNNRVNLNLGIEMVLVEGGEFIMGYNRNRDGDTPEHRAKIDSFLMGKYPVTQAQWKKIQGSNPAYFEGDNLPVEQISWVEAVEFCNRLSMIEGLEPCYTVTKLGGNQGWSDSIEGTDVNVDCDFGANGYRLPTEAEWEFAAKGGLKNSGFLFSGSNNFDEVGWTTENSNETTHEVGKKKPNELGIYDLTGNVWEWCWDAYSENFYRLSLLNNPVCSDSGPDCVIRGGCWELDSNYCSNYLRDYEDLMSKDATVGFRLVRNFESAGKKTLG
jgi:Serine/threonine protein kinase